MKKIALAQIQSIVGDLEGNRDKILEWSQRAEEDGCDLILFPELAVCGYPPEDLLLKPAFKKAVFAINDEIAARSGKCAIAFGSISRATSDAINFNMIGDTVEARKHVQDSIFNSLIIARDKRVLRIFNKYHLPNYSVFDEQRYFVPGDTKYVHHYTEVVGMVCEDVWRESGPTSSFSSSAKVALVANASPFYAGKQLERERVVSYQANRMNRPIFYVNCVGGQDELVFDGGSFVMDANGDLIARCGQFEEEYLIVDMDSSEPRIAPHKERYEEIFEALVVGTRDYVHNTGFTDIVLGISGGIDSAVVAAIAYFALGKTRVHGVMLPSRYSSGGSLLDGEKLMKNLGIDEHILDINVPHHAVETALKSLFDGTEPGVAEENVQSRLRGLLLMALSNKFGWMVLTTGNKSEVAVGYSTLYGDMAGGYNPLKDLYKTEVYALAKWINAKFGDVIPKDIIEKEPSAELRLDQVDQDSLPPYSILDAILYRYIEFDNSIEDISMDFDPDVVLDVITKVDRNEYKRRQAAPGARISPKAFGRDRRLPIANAFRG